MQEYSDSRIKYIPVFMANSMITLIRVRHMTMCMEIFEKWFDSTIPLHYNEKEFMKVINKPDVFIFDGWTFEIGLDEEGPKPIDKDGQAKNDQRDPEFREMYSKFWLLTDEEKSKFRVSKGFTFTNEDIEKETKD